MLRPTPRFIQRSVRCSALLFLMLLGCAQQLAAPTAAPTGDQAPVTLRNLQVTTVEGHRAVLMRLSRVPMLVRHSSSRHPAQITVQAWGPVGEGDLAEHSIPQPDAQISQVRVSRRDGALSVTLDLNGDEPPAYRVHEMADWIMIRFPTPGSAETEG